MVKLSVIIPYFETYKLTYNLLVRLLEQLTNEVEILLIDDGCEEHRFDDLNIRCKNIRIVHKKNEGIAKTRNLGIKMAQGKYVSFIDCDDLVSTDYINTIINAIDKNDVDIINFDWYDLTTKTTVNRPSNAAPWKAAYKKDTMLMFREDMKYGSEDVPFQAEIQEKINNKEYSIVYLDKTLYYYNSHRRGSLIWEKQKALGGKVMVKMIALENFKLEKFNELKNIHRYDYLKNDKGKLFKHDTFECDDEELIKYLLNECEPHNPVNRAVAKILEYIPNK